MTIEQCAEYLKTSDQYMVFSHVRPDGDTLGSCAALVHALRRIGKTAYMYPNDEVTETYLPFVEPYFAPEDYEQKINVSVDVASENMLIGGNGRSIDLCVDHHPSNSHYADNVCVYPERSSCGEIILEIIKKLSGNIDEDEAQLLYVAVSTDTGCFCYSNTNSDTFRAAAELMDAGAKLPELNQLLFRKTSIARLRLEGMIYSGMTYHYDGLVSIATVTLDMMEKAQATEDDCSDLANLAGRAKDALVSVTIREIKPGVSKLSLRSSKPVNVSDICAQFGGGGHELAAGCTLECRVEEAKEKILAAIEPQLP